MNKKVIIVGGGIAGLAAGIYACQEGFEAHVFEKNPVPGGNCSGWRRGDYYIDNCLHWLTGTIPDSFQFKIWKELGVMDENTSFISRESFYSSEYEGQKLTLWRDVDKTEAEMLSLSPEDEIEIKKFIKYVKFAESLQKPREKEGEISESRQLISDITSNITPIELLQGMIEYIGLSLETLADKFTHPLIKRLITDFMAKEYEAYWLVMAYSFFASGNGDLPHGGSMSVVQSMVDKFNSLGGCLHLDSEVEKLVIDAKRFKQLDTVFNKNDMKMTSLKEIVTRQATAILLNDGTLVTGDYFISAAGIDFTFNHLLGSRKYMPRRIKSLLKHKKEHHIYSSYQVAFAVDGLMNEVDDTLSFDCTPIDVGRRAVDRITVKNYRIYGDFIAPKDKTVIQVSIVQYKEDFSYWKKLYANREHYYLAKKNVALAVMDRILKRFPDYENKLTILDTWTPMTYYTRNHCEYGAYMRYITTVASTTAFLPTKVQGLSNVFLAGHSLMYPGGTPFAALSGKNAVEKIKKLSDSGIKLIIKED